MLPSAHRMRRSSDFTMTVRRGRRTRRGALVLHHLAMPEGATPGSPARIGFVVSRSVGGSVERNRVVRRLRHVVRARLADLAPGSLTVVRALPSAATAGSAQLDADLRGALDAVRPRRALVSP